jgi:hypothetical protein
VAPVLALYGAGAGPWAGREHGQAGVDELLAGAQHPLVSGGCARFDHDDGLRGAGRLGDHRCGVSGVEFAEHIADGDQIGGGAGERGAEVVALPLRGAQRRVGGACGEGAAEVERSLGPVEDGGGEAASRPCVGNGPGGGAGTAADVDVLGGRPLPCAGPEGGECRLYCGEGGGHPVCGVCGDVGRVAQHGRVGRRAAPVVGYQPLDGLSGAARRQSVEHRGECDTQLVAEVAKAAEAAERGSGDFHRWHGCKRR